MSTPASIQISTSVDEYLAAEDGSAVRHEYLAGQVVAMVGASRTNNLLVGALFGRLQPLARRRDCQLFFADMKLRIDHEGESWFYYPDLLVSCDRDDRDPLFVRNPCLVVEVLSPGTEQVDTREKLLAYRL